MNWKRLAARSMFYPTLLWNILLGRMMSIRNWWDEVDEHVIIGALPFESDVEPLAELGVRAVVNTCEEYPGPVDGYAKYGVTQHRMPTIDFTHPKLEDVESAVEFMDQQIAKGHRVYVHCKAGRARSATVVMCWLIKNRQITAEEAQMQLNRCRPHVNQHLMERPVVREYEAIHLKANDDSVKS